MLRTDVTGTRPVVQTDATTTITSVTSASQEALNRLTLISVGKQFQAQIMSRLNDGTFLVRIADTTARMALPDTAKAGDTIMLTLLSPSPRPTFILGERAGASEQPVANLLQDTTSTSQVGKTVVVTDRPQLSVPPELIPSSTTASFSPAGRLVDNLLHAVQLNGAPTKILGQTPVVASPNVETATLAKSLHNALEFSGVFYESHLAQWANGNRKIENLMREPQAHAGGTANSSAATIGSRGETSLIDMMRALETAQQTQMGAAENQLQTAALNNETARLIGLQLGVLEQRRITWQGELWPGQKFEWEVSEETPRHESSEQVQSWRSTVRFEMPTLGAISASIHLTNGHLQMHIGTSREDAASILRAHGNKLASALEAAGSPLDLLTVKRHESA